jgi:hypothetical protein
MKSTEDGINVVDIATKSTKVIPFANNRDGHIRQTLSDALKNVEEYAKMNAYDTGLFIIVKWGEDGLPYYYYEAGGILTRADANTLLDDMKEQILFGPFGGGEE